jgi:hypothetical protein
MKRCGICRYWCDGEIVKECNFCDGKNNYKFSIVEWIREKLDLIEK